MQGGHLRQSKGRAENVEYSDDVANISLLKQSMNLFFHNTCKRTLQVLAIYSNIAMIKSPVCYTNVFKINNYIDMKQKILPYGGSMVDWSFWDIFLTVIFALHYLLCVVSFIKKNTM